jgi:hypothetical protein
MKLLGLEIEPKTSFTSLAAFILSLWGVGQSTYFFFQGSSLKLIAPKEILIYRDICYSSSSEIIRVVIPATIINNAPKGYVGVLNRIDLRFRIGRDLEFDATNFVDLGGGGLGSSGVIGCDKDKDKNYLYSVGMKDNYKASAIDGGASIVENTLFTPTVPNCVEGGESCYKKNYIDGTYTIAELKKLASSGESLKFVFELNFDDNRISQNTCNININNDVVNALDKFNFIFVACE